MGMTQRELAIEWWRWREFNLGRIHAQSAPSGENSGRYLARTS